MPHVFISYSRHDVAAANQLAELLRAAGVDTFVDYQRMEAGENFPERLAHEIEIRDVLVLLMSQHSAASKWVQREVQYADSLNKTIVMLRLDATGLPKGLFFLQYQDHINATTWKPPDVLPAPVLEKLSRALGIRSTPLTPPPPVRTVPAAPEFVIARTGAADFRSINDALANVPEGAILHMRPGVYREAIVLNKAVEIIGDGARDDILLESDAGHVIEMATDYAIVRGLTLRQRSDESELLVCIYIPLGRLTLEDCDIISSSLACIHISNRDTEPFVRRCTIHDSSGAGIFISNKAGGALEECQIYNNRVGIASSENAQPLVRRCTVRDGEKFGILIWQNGAGTFEDCIVTNNGETGKHPGIEIYEGGDPTLRRCTISNNTGSGVRSHTNGRGTVVDCDLRGNGYGAFDIDDTSHVVRRNNEE